MSNRRVEMQRQQLRADIYVISPLWKWMEDGSEEGETLRDGEVGTARSDGGEIVTAVDGDAIESDVVVDDECAGQAVRGAVAVAATGADDRSHENNVRYYKYASLLPSVINQCESKGPYELAAGLVRAMTELCMKASHQ